MTQELHDRLDKYERSLYTAYYLDYLRNLGQTAVNELDEIYEELFGHKSNLKNGCSYCVLQEVKKIGREYYAYQTPKEEEKTDEQTDTPIKKKKNTKTKK